MRDWIDIEAERSLRGVIDEIRPLFADAPRRGELFEQRLEGEYERLFRLMHQLYGWRWDFSWQLVKLIRTAAAASLARPKWLRRRDVEAAAAGWMHDSDSLWAMTYTERFAGSIDGVAGRVGHLQSLGVTHLHLMPPYAVPDGPHDGGYAVSSYRRLRPDLGDIADLTTLARRLDEVGISLVLDFVANHTAHDHPWAEAAKRGEAPYDRYYFLFDERSEVTPYLPHLREIFPDRGGDAFTWCDEAHGRNGGKWVWTTFYPFQWDLNYSNPDVLVAMTGELLGIVNLGASVIRMDATPFLWKREGTSCENLPEAHTLLQIMNAVTAISAPSVRFLSEAIVHPDDVRRFVRPDECALGYNPVVMSVLWEAVATRDVGLLEDALTRRSRLPSGCQWITYLRSHDDIGWGFADEDAASLGIDPAGHRRFLNDFYSGTFPGTFARGALFQHNERTGDARISGTLAALAGLEAALESGDGELVDLAVGRIIALQTVAYTAVGVPMLYLGDEVGTCNDHRYADEPDHAHDNRWMHRPRLDPEVIDRAERDPGSPGGRILAAMRRLAAVRRDHPALGGGVPTVIGTGNRAVIGYVRTGSGRRVLVVVNLGDRPAAVTIDAGGTDWVDVTSSEPVSLALTLPPYGTLIAEGPVHDDGFAPGQVG